MHLDLKPENMMYFSGSGGESILKAIDFGSSKLLKHVNLSPADERGNRANLCLNIGDAVGSRGYTSPEIRIKCAELSWEQSAESISYRRPLRVNFFIK
jgi:serine/threonine protein kinase